MNGRTNVTTGTNTDDIVVPLDPITNFSVIPGNGFVSVQWTDPKDKYATPEGETAQDPQQLVSEFDYTIIVRKIGSAPVDFKDGEVSVLSSVRNQYAESAYVDNSVTYDETYYYAAWVFNKDGIESDGVFADPVTPKYYDSILANNTWERIEEAGNNGIASSLWSIGDAIDIVIANETMTIVILDFNHSQLSDGSGTAAITFGSKDLMKQTYTPEIRSTWCGLTSRYNYLGSLLGEIIPTPLDIKTEYVSIFYGNCSIKTVNAKVFPFSTTEIFNKEYSGPYSGLRAGTQYPYYATTSNRIKRLANGTGKTANWILTDNDDDGYGSSAAIAFVNTSGNSDGVGTVSGTLDNYPVGINFGFCVGKAIT